MEPGAIVYRVDAEDRIVSVSSAWDPFAIANNGRSVTASSIIGRNLFEFIADRTTRHLYRQMLARIRSGGYLAYRYRCDSPECRRLMEMQVVATDAAGGVEFRSITLEEHPRTPIEVPQADGASDDDPGEPQRACGWCNRLDVEGTWMEIEDALPRLRLLERASPPAVTHGICEDCLARMTDELEFATGA